MSDNDDVSPIAQGTTEFKTVKAGCGIRFDPDELSDESGFDFSEAEKLAGHELDESDDTKNG